MPGLGAAIGGPRPDRREDEEG